MKTTLTIFTLTVLCVTLICPSPSFAQRFVDGQMPDIFLNIGFGAPDSFNIGFWVNDIKFSPDGTTLASGHGGWDFSSQSYFGSCRLWDVASGTLKDTLEDTGSVYSVAFSPDGTTLAISINATDQETTNAAVKLWDVASGTLKDTLTRDEIGGKAYSVAFSPDGTTLAINIARATSDAAVKLWDVASGTLKDTLTRDEIGGSVYNSVAFSPDGTTLAISINRGSIARGTTDAAVKLWDVVSGTLKDTLIEEYADWVYSVAFSPDGNLLASGAGYFTGGLDVGFIHLWDVASGSLKARFRGHTGSVYSVAFSPDGTTLAGGLDGTLELWDVTTRQSKTPKVTLSNHVRSVSSIAFSPDGTTLASGSNDGVVRLWKALPPANADGVVNIADLVEVAQNFGQVGQNNADVNGDGVVNIVDIILVAVALGEVAGAPAADTEVFSTLTAEEVSQWLIEAKHLQTENPTYLRGILFLEQLLALLAPKETMLLANYPNPFNPETWIPYHLAISADVTLTIYDINGHVVRSLDLGYQQTGVYQSRLRAAYWDGRNTQGEPVASGVYFYTLTAGDFSATRKMLIRK